MITTFNKLISIANTQKIFLAEIEPSHFIENWTLYSGSIYYNDLKTIFRNNKGGIDVQNVYEDGSILSEATSIAGVTAGKWFYKDGILYVRASSGDIYSKTIVANYKFYFTDVGEKGDSTGVIFNDCFYEPRILAIPEISQKKTDFFWGISIITDGSLSLDNRDGYFDNMYEKLAWDNKPITIYAGGENLPYSEYQKMFSGIISDKNLSVSMFDFAFIDRKSEWETNIPLNSFNQTNYPWLLDDNVGKPIPLGWGTIKRAPVVCTTEKYGTATGTHKFKIVDTSLHSISSIDQVYVKGNKVNHSSGSISAATFKLSTSTYTPGDDVVVDYVGYKSGTVIENPITILKEIGTTLIGVTWGSTRWDTATINQAITDAEEFPIGLHIGERISANDIAGQIVQSCLGTFYVNNSGQYAASIWSTDIPTAPTDISDVEIYEGTLKARTKIDDIKKTVIVEWRKNWSEDKYSSLQKTSETTEKIYGITNSKSVQTLLSTSNGAQLYLDRLLLILEGATIVISFSSALQLALKNIGDRFQINFKRNDGESNISWLDSRLLEIFEIKKNFSNGSIEITADDLKGIGGDIGHWTSDTPTFPSTYGGGSAATWDKTWSVSLKAYAKGHFGYWCDDNGFADPTDPDSKNISRWW